ncbi:MAG: AAA family ATPase [Planctomycetia bacterium]|nr:AAA family ATPase [Planctomycetia bacterium]
MPINDLRPIPLDWLAAAGPPPTARWLWHGYLAPGDVTVLTSLWKTGKTTLLTGLLQHLGTGEPFLGRDVARGRAWIVSEESIEQWRERMGVLKLGPHVQLLARPFRGRPTIDEWHLLLDRAVEARAAGELDLLIVDPLASFLPGRCESDAASLLEALQPLHRLTAAGAAVALLHHPRKRASEPGQSARGSGALLAFADTSLELTRYSTLKTDANRRLILAQSRRPEVPARLAYEWNAATGEFRLVADPRERQFEENWQTVLLVLQSREAAITHKELHESWPSDVDRPSVSALYGWLNHAFARKLLRREGKGTRLNPWRYRLENEDDKYWDRNQLPPIRLR